jgi:hypothetical protein
MVKQLSVFLENSQGRLASMTQTLGEAGVDLLALSIADTTSFGILRAIVDDADKAMAVLKQAGYTVNTTEVLAVLVPDSPGGLAGILALLNSAHVNVEYLYSFVRKAQGNALILFKVDQVAKAAETLAGQGIKMLDQPQILEL